MQEKEKEKERERDKEKARTGKNSLPFSTTAYFFQVLLPFITRSAK